MIGFNTNFSTELPFITRWVNRIPTIKTNVPSILSFRGEIANLITGKPKNTQLQGESNVYIDDFEEPKPILTLRALILGNFLVFLSRILKDQR